MTLASTVTCPNCGAQVEETMPVDYCVVRWLCPVCGAEARPAPGDCCVYCTYGSAPCPPIQEARARGGLFPHGG